MFIIIYIYLENKLILIENFQLYKFSILIYFEIPIIRIQ